MNGIETILARIESDTQQKIAELERSTQEQLLAIRAGYEAQRDQLREQLRTLGEQTASERYERLCSAAEMEVKKLTLAARQEVIAEAYALALEKLCSLPQERYIDLLVHLAKKAAAKGGCLIFSAADRESVGAEVVRRSNAEHNCSLTLSEKTADIRAGFVLDEGATEINCSFETLVRLSRERTERAVSGILFP